MISQRTRRRVVKLQHDLIDGLDMRRFGSEDPSLQVLESTISVRMGGPDVGNLEIFCIDGDEGEAIWLLAKDGAVHGVYGSTPELVLAIKQI